MASGDAADINSDCEVDIFDYNLLVQNFGNTTCGNLADIDGNCKVDIFDYNALLGNFGAASQPTNTPTPIPIPTKAQTPTPTGSKLPECYTLGYSQCDPKVGYGGDPWTDNCDDSDQEFLDWCSGAKCAGCPNPCQKWGLPSSGCY